jgi:AMMECR1 domain-containing protein
MLCHAGTSRSSQLTHSEDDTAPEETPGRQHLQPGIFTTKQQLKRARRKRDKLARRALRGSAGSFQPASPAAAAAAEDGISSMLVETSLGFGRFEAHTTGTACGWLSCLLHTASLTPSFS